jgi:hypothetical protein
MFIRRQLMAVGDYQPPDLSPAVFFNMLKVVRHPLDIPFAEFQGI